MTVFCGLDLGQTNDRTAFSAVEMTGQPGAEQFDLRHLERFPIGTRYPDQVRRVVELMAAPVFRDATLVVDQTGVGRPVVDMFREAGLDLIAVTIHGGDVVTHEGLDYRVPKRDLVMAAVTIMQSRRFKVVRSLAEAQTFVKELLAFRIKVNIRTGHDSYEAWRDGDHDDLVLSVALACWYAQHGGALPFSWLDDQEAQTPQQAHDAALRAFARDDRNWRR